MDVLTLIEDLFGVRAYQDSMEVAAPVYQQRNWVEL